LACPEREQYPEKENIAQRELAQPACVPKVCFAIEETIQETPYHLAAHGTWVVSTTTQNNAQPYLLAEILASWALESFAIFHKLTACIESSLPVGLKIYCHSASRGQVAKPHPRFEGKIAVISASRQNS
jgi:hypothetical protein